MRPAKSALVLLLAFAAASAHARQTGEPAGFVIRYPSGDAPDPATLQARILDPSVSAIVFTKGTHVFSSRLFVFKRAGLTLCGITGDPDDVTIESAATTAFQLEQVEETTFRGLTIRVRPAGGAGGVAINLNSSPLPGVDGFADRTFVESCSFNAYVGVQVGVRARELTISRCEFTSSAFRAGDPTGGVGVLWEDGRDLFVTQSRFRTEPGVSAIAGVFVRGAQEPAATGERARRIYLTRNTVAGDFAAGLDLADMRESIVARNSIRFPAEGVPLPRGRVGIVVRRASASQSTEDYVLQRNVFRRAHYGVWLLNARDGEITDNDFRGCGSEDVDGTGEAAFGDHGGAIRINDALPTCAAAIARNDFRGLRSPLTSAAVVLLPSADVCSEDDNPDNRTDRGRAVFGGEEP